MIMSVLVFAHVFVWWLAALCVPVWLRLHLLVGLCLVFYVYLGVCTINKKEKEITVDRRRQARTEIDSTHGRLVPTSLTFLARFNRHDFLFCLPKASACKAVIDCIVKNTQ